MLKSEEKQKIKIQKYDEVFDYVGGLGRFQIGHLFLLCLPPILAADSIYINFIGYNTPHWCAVPELQDLPPEVQKNVAIPHAEGDKYSSCEYFARNYSEYTADEFTHWNRSAQAPSAVKKCQNWEYDTSLFTSTIVSRWDVVCDRYWLIGLLSTMFIAGHTVGSMVVGEISDRYGRKTSIVMFAGVRLIGAVLQVVAPNYALMALARLLVGFGVLGTYISGYVLSVEVVHPKHRVWYAAMNPMTYTIGYLFVPAVAYLMKSYQLMLIPNACLTLAMMGYYWVLPESARWLCVKGRQKEAEGVLRKIAKINGREYPDNLDLSPLCEEESKVKQKGLRDLLRDPHMRKWMLIIDFYWFSVSLIYFAMSLNSGSLHGNIFLNTFLLGIVEIPSDLINIYVMHTGKVGRKTMSCISMSLAGVASFISIPLILNKSSISQTLSVVFALLGKAGVTMAFTDIYIYTSEVTPTEVRNIAMGTASFCARISGMVSPHVGGILTRVWQPMPFLIYGIVGVISGLLMLIMPETRGLRLPQTIEEAVVTLRKRDRKAWSIGLANDEQNDEKDECERM